MGVRFHPLPADLFGERARPYLHRLNAELRDLFALEGVLRQPAVNRRSDRTIARGSEPQVHRSRLTPTTAVDFSGAAVVAIQPTAPALTGEELFWLRTDANPQRFYAKQNDSSGNPEWVQFSRGR